MDTFILKIQILLIIQILGTRCDNILVNTTLFVDKGDTVVLNCANLCANGTSWEGPRGSIAMPNQTEVVAYSDGLHINPNLKITNIAIYSDYNKGTCHLQIVNFSTTNDGIYLCSFLSGSLDIKKYNVFIKRPPSSMKIVNVSENNVLCGKEGVRMELKCTIKTGKPAATLIWSKEGLNVANGSKGSLLYQITPTKFDHLQNMTCYAFSDLLTAPLSQTIYLDIQYSPDLKIIRSNKGSIIEGESFEMCCFSNSNPPVHYMAWYQNNYEVFSWRQTGTTSFEGFHKNFSLPISTFYRNRTGIYSCFAENGIGKSTFITDLTVLYAPDVKVTYTNSENSIILHCVPYGKPDNYTFYDWEHRSDFNEHIRWLSGTPEGQLIIEKYHVRKMIEDDGSYVCSVSNGVFNQKGRFSQEGQVCFESRASPVFVSENKPIQVGKFGRGVEIKVIIYDKLYNSTVLIRNNGTTLKLKPTIENITSHDTFYGVNVRVSGIQYTFQMYLTSTNDVTNFTVEACNDVGCNYFYVQVISPDFSNPDWKIVGSLIGGFFILSICLNIYCLLKRKRLSRMVPEIPLEVQYDEIGIIHGNSAGIQALSNSVQEAETSVDGPAVEETYPHLTTLEQNDSADNSIKSLSMSLMSWDGYEQPLSYQSIDPADIEIHPYGTVESYLYQNTIIFPKQISSNPLIPNDEKRNPWLVIYEKNMCK